MDIQLKSDKIHTGTSLIEYDKMTWELPSLHDLRALGLYNITQQYGKKYAQALAGHATVKMTDHYIEGHEAPKPEKISYR